MGDLVSLQVDWHGPSLNGGSSAGRGPSRSGGSSAGRGPSRSGGSSAGRGPRRAGPDPWRPLEILAGRRREPTGVDPALIGACLRWKRYRPWSVAWISGRCDSCLAPFSKDAAAGALHSGYSVIGGGPAGQDDYYWICAPCVDLLAHEFGWSLLNTRGETR